jgi:hypothetical protein
MPTARPGRHAVLALVTVAFVALGTAAVPDDSEATATTMPGVVYFFMDNGTEIKPGPLLVPAARRLNRTITSSLAYVRPLSLSLKVRLSIKKL